MGSPDVVIPHTSKYQCLIYYDDLVRQDYPNGLRGLIGLGLL